MNAARKFTIAICTLALSGTLALSQETAPPQGTAPSQNPPTSAPGGQHRMHRDPVAMRLQMMSQKLNLTDDQKAKIQPVLQNEMQQARAIHQNTSLTPDQQKNCDQAGGGSFVSKCLTLPWAFSGTAKDTQTGPEYNFDWHMHGRWILGGFFGQLDNVIKGNGIETRSLEILS